MAAKIFLWLVLVIWARLIVVSLLSICSALANRRLSIPETSSVSLKEVTIVVAAYQESRDILRTLQALKPSLQAGATLIVVDDGSTDGTSEIIRRALSGIERTCLIVSDRNQGKAQALNLAMAKVKTQFMLTLDADTILPVASLKRAHAALSKQLIRNRAVSAVAFDVSISQSDKLFSEIQGVEYAAALNFERRGQGMLGAISVAPGAASLWRVQLLHEIGGFSDQTVTEDVDATLALAAKGYRVLHVPGAEAFTEAPASLKHLLSQRRRWSLGHYQNIPRHAASVYLNWRFGLLTYPNFFFLSAFLPSLYLSSFSVLLTGPAETRPLIEMAMALWLSLVFVQRGVGLRLAGRRTSLGAFLVEPFATSLLHLVSLIMVVAVAIRRLLGQHVVIWSHRD